MLSVKEVYDKIAPHFDVSRQRVWGSVRTFLTDLPSTVKILDLGCGNGKNMLFRKELNITGVDISPEQVKICRKKNLNVIEASITELPFENDTFDSMLCIATYHHIDNDIDRQKALHEMKRCLKQDGTVLITVWALEQHEGSTFAFKNTDELVPWTTTEGLTYYSYYHIYKKDQLESEMRR